MRHILSILTKNEAGVVSRVSNLFSGRGYSIESITASTTLDKEHSKITIVTTGDEKVIEQLKIAEKIATHVEEDIKRCEDEMDEMK